MWIDRDACRAAISTLKERAGIPLGPCKGARQLADFQGPHARHRSGTEAPESRPKASRSFEHDFFSGH
jgi:hypothetical protein